VQIWDAEYREKHTIPSSTRPLPSKALLIVEPLIDPSQIETVLDAGCGNGRNSIHFASKRKKVVAADFSSIALSMVQRAAKDHPVAGLLLPLRVDLNRTLPFADACFDLCVDSYVSCHFAEDIIFRQYWEELGRVTRPKGYVFTSMFCTDDEYYNALPRQCLAGVSLVMDPMNGITKRLHDEKHFSRLFPPVFHISYFVKFQFSDIVLTREYRRSLLVGLLQKL
jgi:SAM-dependent methyltransferase